MTGRISAATRVSIGLAFMTASIFWAAQAIGLVPDTARAMMDGRRNLCEAVAVYCSSAVLRGKPETIRAATVAVLARNPDVLSAGLRQSNGKLIFTSGDHLKHWQAPTGDKSTAEYVRVPIFAGENRWGTAEIAFRSTQTQGFYAAVTSTTVKLSVFVIALGFFGYRIYLRKTLAYLDPASVIPDRVRSLLDTLAEGVLVLDERERILLANKVFTGAAGIEMKDLAGRKPSELPWHVKTDAVAGPDGIQPTGTTEHPWTVALRTGELQTAVILRIDGKDGAPRALSTNCAPIVGDRGDRRGALVTFNDITSVEEKNSQLREMLTVLEHSRDEIDRQNKELQLLATTDPLTGCRNRRSFFVELETHWSAARRYGQPLTAIMVDVDHFKKINDQHGHAVGDQVLQRVAQLLKSGVRDCDIVGRYGGEEFCILLPHSDIDAAVQAAERLRASIVAAPLGNVRVTASFGVAALGPGIHLPQDLLEQADKSLYAAKRTGRNRVVRRDSLTPEILAEQSAAAAKLQAAPVDAPAGLTPISFHVVTSLMTALAHRDRSTAEHSQRVAALCVETASGLMSARDCFTLEVAALLHDVGKMGVPDSILQKPAELTDLEWSVMRTHEEMGESIIAAAFASPELTDIVRTHHAFYGGCAEHPNLPSGANIAMGARILSIADAYDAIVSNRVYRAGREKDFAFTELRRCAGTQFDPELVERFIATVKARDEGRVGMGAGAEIPPHTALRLRLELGILACAAGAADLAGLGKAARHLADLASTGGMKNIADHATKIQEAASTDVDLDKIKSLTAELVDLCRSVRADSPPAVLPVPHNPTPALPKA